MWNPYILLVSPTCGHITYNPQPKLKLFHRPRMDKRLNRPEKREAHNLFNGIRDDMTLLKQHRYMYVNKREIKGVIGI